MRLRDGIFKLRGSSSGSGGGGTWGSITGTLTDQTDLATALGLKAPADSPTFTTQATFSYATISRVAVFDGSKNLVASSITTTTLAFLDATSSIQTQLNAKQATGNYITALTGEVTASGPGSVAATVANSAVIAKVLTGYTSGAGTVASTDTILQAIQKLNGNVALKAPLASPTFTGTIGTPLTGSRLVSTDGSGNLQANGSLTAGAVVVASGTGALSTPGEFDAGNSSTTKTIDFTNGPAQKLTMTGNCTVTLSNGVAGQAYVLRTINGAGPYTLVFAAGKYPGGVAPPLTAVNAAIDIFNIYFDGTNYYISAGQNWS